jgi:hypothetical protein
MKESLECSIISTSKSLERLALIWRAEDWKGEHGVVVWWWWWCVVGVWWYTDIT